MSQLSEIQDFLSPKRLAVAGVSRNKKKFGYTVFKELRDKGFEVSPVNPNTDEIDGVKCYASVSLLPGDVKHLHIVTSRKETEKIVDEAVKKGISFIWIQQSSDTPEAVELAQNSGVKLIYKRCIMMYAEPVRSIHAFHRFLNKVFGVYPK